MSADRSHMLSRRHGSPTPPTAAGASHRPALPARRARALHCALGGAAARRKRRPRWSRASRSSSASSPTTSCITRFLNPDDDEDAEYLVGQPAPAPGTSTSGVFMRIENQTEDELAVGAASYRPRHAREPVRADRDREPLRARDRRDRPRRGRPPAPRHAAGDRAEPGLAAALPRRRRGQREPAAEAGDRAVAGTGEVILDI